mmetsp:Transcript_6657/g.14380  ORF Transcript_6657/g.14380 Transcript_6657/m.14380 type:complete len:224 (-) Transcript_6657:418-1089(-)
MRAALMSTSPPSAAALASASARAFSAATAATASAAISSTVLPRAELRDARAPAPADAFSVLDTPAAMAISLTACGCSMVFGGRSINPAGRFLAPALPADSAAGAGSCGALLWSSVLKGVALYDNGPLRTRPMGLRGSSCSKSAREWRSTPCNWPSRSRYAFQLFFIHASCSSVNESERKFRASFRPFLLRILATGAAFGFSLAVVVSSGLTLVSTARSKAWTE